MDWAQDDRWFGSLSLGLFRILQIHLNYPNMKMVVPGILATDNHRNAHSVIGQS